MSKRKNLQIGTFSMGESVNDWVPFEELRRQIRKAGQKTEPAPREDEDDHERRNSK